MTGYNMPVKPWLERFPAKRRPIAHIPSEVFPSFGFIKIISRKLLVFRKEA
jgi:hypothetical protein